MTKEQKDKLEQQAKSRFTLITQRNYYIEGAETILDNYHDYGLQSMEKYKDMVSANVRLGAENQRLREALERIIIESEDNEQVDWMYVAENMVGIAKEALKQ